jgi:thioredoxin-related protein
LVIKLTPFEISITQTIAQRNNKITFSQKKLRNAIDKVFRIVYIKVAQRNREVMNVLNGNTIKDRMKELGIVQSDVSKRLQIAEATVSLKLNGKRPMYLDEAQELARMLEISDEQFGSYFFNS